MKTTIIGALLGIALVIAAIIWNAYVLTILWGWFIVPYFHAELLPMKAAVGLALLASYLTKQRIPPPKSNKPDWEALSDALLKPLITLIMGYLVIHLF